ncbi:uncharacterized protein MYCFIDRAFT_173365 [Pseudocercospora fijiensis CIRAD86]|uniref:Uncharacterized protein n=1 Tax=Pseudocercospora fijiensis (strain CIRAD86) TaxID=383855 RepID=M2Z3F2_PSEFD|nr:uncharacterized protein MYCFIDRAFT_173365 [Pseudocercospora fijiensis CIRAD86]EME84360.1 hypothetical protein MYCFIDRAFT_173365 [Pseudocercospora fijiensis CIRAD86]
MLVQEMSLASTSSSRHFVFPAPGSQDEGCTNAKDFADLLPNIITQISHSDSRIGNSGGGEGPTTCQYVVLSDSTLLEAPISNHCCLVKSPSVRPSSASSLGPPSEYSFELESRIRAYPEQAGTRLGLVASHIPHHRSLSREHLSLYLVVQDQASHPYQVQARYFQYVRAFLSSRAIRRHHSCNLFSTCDLGPSHHAKSHISMEVQFIEICPLLATDGIRIFREIALAVPTHVFQSSSGTKNLRFCHPYAFSRAVCLAPIPCWYGYGIAYTLCMYITAREVRKRALAILRRRPLSNVHGLLQQIRSKADIDKYARARVD